MSDYGAGTDAAWNRKMEQESKDEEKAERQRSYAIQPHPFNPHVGGFWDGYCKQCDKPKHALIHLVVPNGVR